MIKNIYTVVGFCPDEILNTFEKIKKELNIDFDPYISSNDNHYILKNKPHFAIKRTCFTKDDITESNLINNFLSIKHGPVKISFNKVDIFKDTPYGPTLFLPLNISTDLQDLHEQIVNTLNPLVLTKNPEHELEGYTPHTTFQYNIPLDKVEISTKTINNTLVNTSFVCDKLYLLKDFNIDLDERVEIAQLSLT